jgi:hypothetical protein
MSTSTSTTGNFIGSRITLTAMSLCLTILGLELGLRMYHGKVFHFESLTVENGRHVGRMKYDPQLGWVPKTGQLGKGWTSHVDDAGLRSNGTSVSPQGHPILAVGDSFTFGDDVEDSETWEAYLEEALNMPVLNAGVSAYGIDQAVLRAELLLDKCHPDIVLLSFISDDIDRAEFSYFSYGGWKPYFEFVNGSLTLRNVPVSQKPRARDFQILRHALSYSFLANAVLSRVAGQWWKYPRVVEQVHKDGEDVAVNLMAHLDGLVKKQGGQLIVIALGNDRIEDNARLPSVIKRVRERGLEVLDLSTKILELPPEQLRTMFGPTRHYNPAMNRWVADHIAAFLRRREMVQQDHPDYPRHIL